MDFNRGQMSSKPVSQSATKQFGAQNEQIITLEPENGQSGGKNANYSKIEVVPTQQEAAAVSMAPKMEYNDISSRLVKGMDCDTALKHMTKVLTAYSQEIEFQTDSAKETGPEITDGIVFVDNYYAIHFKVYIFNDADGEGTRIEFRRNSGNALAASKFLGEINSAFSLLARDAKRESTGNLFVDAVVAATEQAVRDSLSKSSLSDVIDAANGQEKDTMIALDTNFDGMELKMNEEQQEMMMIHEALISDEVVGDLDESAENYLLSKLLEAKALSKDQVDHNKLAEALMTKETLLHRDVAVVRASFLVLERLVATHSKSMANDQFMAIVGEAMRTAQYGLIKTFALNFLRTLAKATTKEDWSLDSKTKASLKKEIDGQEFAVLF